MSSEEKIFSIPIKPEDHKDVWIFAEVRHGKLVSTAYELLNIGGQLAQKINEKLVAVIMGQDVEKHAQTLIDHGAQKVYVLNHESLAQFVDEYYANVLVELIRSEKPNKLLLPASALGRSFGSRVAVLANTGLTADATALGINEKRPGLLDAIRPTFGGTLMATILCTRGHRPEMVTVRPMAFDPSPKVEGKTGEIVKIPVDPSKYELHERHVKFIKEEEGELDISQAATIVSGGYGVGGEKGFEPLRAVAKTLGGAIGASRRAVDAGWITYKHQVGLTGRAVRPKLYIACGISGQIQHLAGMNSSETIVTVNKDPEAPLMKLATFSVEADLFEFLPAFNKELAKEKGR
jgi:electron transfer flavoprotein alpha subunit